jgi:hypothetical protein
MSDAAAFAIAALISKWLEAPGWVWIPLSVAAILCTLAEIGSDN